MHTPFGELPEHLASQLTMAEQFDYLHGQRRRISRRRFLVAGGLVAGGAATAGLWLQGTNSPTPIGPRHVAFGADPSREATISFSTSGSMRVPLVQYGLDSSFDGQAGVEALTVPGVSTVYGHARLTGLTPGQNYHYRVLADGQTSAVSSFTTAPATPAPFTFTAFGDEKVSAPAIRIIDQIAKLNPAFHLLAGDICYADTTGSGAKSDRFDPTVWDRWLRMIEPVAMSTQWMCATGNHDMEPGYGIHGYSGYLNRFDTPGNGAPGCPSTYTFTYGNVAIIALDANDVSYEIPHNLDYSQGQQTTWLKNLLTKYRAPGSGIDFIIPFFHHCAFSTSAAHGSDGGIRKHWVPLFEEFNVDLVINGHAHLYERTYPIRNGQVTVQTNKGDSVDSALSGPTYITAGGGGAPATDRFRNTGAGVLILADKSQQREDAPWSAPTRTNTHAFLAITVTPPGQGRTTMNVKAISHQGVMIDDVTLTRQVAASL